ncbi:rhombosortase [Vibrio sp.]|uniref:rhombosortase n=1 Tax=Vibrio sp. TaxID=678 RepID=UPI003D0E4B97
MKPYLFLALLTIAAIGFQLEPIHSWLIWHRSDIFAGQWWRILSGNFTHTNWIHLAMNLAGLWIIAAIFRPDTLRLLAPMLLLGSVVGIALFATDLQTYVGLSAILHGLFGYFATREALHGRTSSWLLVVGLLFKVGWEQWFGPSSSTETWIEASVAIDAHLVGALSGIGMALLEFLLHKKRPSQ